MDIDKETNPKNLGSGADGIPSAPVPPERRLVTVLIADLVGSTALISGFDPEKASDILDSTVNAMVQSVRSFGGAVTQLRGDGIVAVFGAPQTHGDVPAHACAAALEMVRRLNSLNAGDVVRGVHVRVGISTGQALVRTLQYDLGGHYDVNGFVTNLAAKLEQVAEPNTILCDPLTAEMAGGRMVFAPSSISSIEGYLESASPMRLVGFAPDRPSPKQADQHAIFGRVPEIQALEKFLSIDNPASRLLVVFGESGIGKTALCNHVLRAKSASSRPAVQVTGNRYATLSSYSVLRVLLSDLTHRAMPECATASSFAEWRKSTNPKLPKLLLRAVSDLIFDKGASNSSLLSNGIGTDLFEDELTAILCDLLSKSGAMVLVDDAQWVDRSSLRIVMHAGRQIDRGRILLATRDLDSLPLAAGVGRLQLRPLSIDAVRGWLRSELGNELPDEDHLLELAESFGMSALAVRQLIDAAGEVEDQGRRSWSYLVAEPERLRSDLNDDSVPPPIEFLISERLDRLSAPTYKLLQCLSVLGEVGTHSILCSFLNENEIEFETGLSELKTSRLVQVDEERDEPTARFAHSAIRSVVYNRLTRDIRRKLHSQLYDVLILKRRSGEKTDASIVAIHADLAQRPTDSAYWYTKAARSALAQGVFEEANQLVERAQRAIGQIQDDEKKRLAIVKLAPVGTSAFVNIGKSSEASDLIQDATEAAAALGDSTAEARVLGVRALAAWKAGKHQACCKDAQRIVDLSDQSGDFQMSAVGKQCLLISSFDLGAYEKCLEIGKDLLPQVAKVARRSSYAFGEPLKVIASFVARAQLEIGSDGDALRLLEENGAGGEMEPQNFGEAGLQITYGRILLRQGRFDEAHTILRSARDWCILTGILNLRAVATAWLATVLVYDNKVQDAAKLLLEDSPFADPDKSGIYPAIHFDIARAMTAAVSGQSKQAFDAADEAVMLARKHSERGHLARGLLSRAAIRAALEPADLNSVHLDLDEASEIALDLGMTPTKIEAARIAEDVNDRKETTANRERTLLRSNGFAHDPNVTRSRICAYALN